MLRLQRRLKVVAKDGKQKGLRLFNAILFLCISTKVSKCKRDNLSCRPLSKIVRRNRDIVYWLFRQQILVRISGLILTDAFNSNYRCGARLALIDFELFLCKLLQKSVNLMYNNLLSLSAEGNMTTKKQLILCLFLVVILGAAVLGCAACQRIAVYGIALNETYLEMNVGDTSTLIATVDAENVIVDVVWTSAHTTIAMVDGGVVTAISAGATSIKATVRDKVAVCTVVVKPTGEEPVVLDNTFRFKTLTEDNGLFSGKRVKDSVNTFDFNTEITAGKDVSYIVCRDIECTDVVRSKIVTLQEGYNKFYILSSCGNVDKMYIVTIELIPKYKVEFSAEDYGGAIITVKSENGTTVGRALAKDGVPVAFGEYLEGEKITVEIDVPLGCEFDGWYYNEYNRFYNGQVKRFVHTVTPNDLSLTVKFHAEQSVENLDFTSTPTMFVINGFKEGANTQSLTVPEYTTGIKPKAFVDCEITDLAWQSPEYDVTYGAGEYPFYNTKVQDFYLYKNVDSIKGGVFYGLSCINLIYSGEIADWIKIDFGSSSNPMHNSTKWYVNGSSSNIREVTEVVIPEGVTVIKKETFNGAHFTDVKLPSTLKRIEYAAFAHCPLGSVELPDGLEHIGQSAFWYCPLNKKELILPSSLKTVGGDAFGCSQVETVVLPSSIESVSDDAFIGSSLKNVLFDGTYTEWQSFKTRIGVKNEAIFAANLYTKNAANLNDNPQRLYWNWTVNPWGVAMWQDNN